MTGAGLDDGAGVGEGLGRPARQVGPGAAVEGAGEDEHRGRAPGQCGPGGRWVVGALGAVDLGGGVVALLVGGRVVRAGRGVPAAVEEGRDDRVVLRRVPQPRLERRERPREPGLPRRSRAAASRSSAVGRQPSAQGMAVTSTSRATRSG